MVNPKSMNEILDDSTKFDRLERVINEYWPKFKDDKIGRSEIRKELKIRFKENEIKYIIDELSDRHLTGFKGSDVIRNIETSSTKTGAYLYLVLGIVLIIVGIILTWLFWQAGWIAFLTLFLISAGTGIIFKANKQINRLNQGN